MRTVDRYMQLVRQAMIYHERASRCTGQSKEALERLAARHEATARALGRRLG